MSCTFSIVKLHFFDLLPIKDSKDIGIRGIISEKILKNKALN